MSTEKFSKIQYLTNIPESAKPYALATSPLIPKGASLLLVKNPKAWFNQINFWQENQNLNLNIETKPDARKNTREINLLNFTDSFTQNISLISRIKNLSQRLINQELKNSTLFISDLKILQLKFPTPQNLKNESLNFKKDDIINLPKILGFLIAHQYEKSRRADQPGTFAVQGGIIEIFPAFAKQPIRIELFGNKIESIKTTDLASSVNNATIEQWNNKTIKQSDNETINIPPLNIKNPTGTILNWLPQNLQIILDEPEPTLKNDLAKFPLMVFEAFPPQKENVLDFHFKVPPLFFGKEKTILNAIKQYKINGYQIFAVSEKLSSLNLPFALSLIPFRLNSGFLDPDQKRLILTDTELFGFKKKKSHQAHFKIDAEFLNELTTGMYIVHLDHGIGHFRGMTQKEVEGVIKEYFILEYAYGDKLFLPIDQADKITRYIGRENPAIHRLHGGIWHQIKKQIQIDAKKIAEELLRIQASRQTQKGFVFSPDTPRQKQLEASFPYLETEDQKKAIENVKKDMEKERPMDHLVCGDVGFGKTEVAIRAAFKAIENQKQVALLAPTTILAQQHYDTFQKRFENFKIKVGILSRFQSKINQKQTLKDLQDGKVDIVIGTHRLLSPDVKFFNLGLMIIDEEQRFGVRHKEKLKSIRPNLDILTLSATPIPRTLNFALSGLRDISTIQTAPIGRKQIKTFICLSKDELIQKAIRRELARNGQVYYLYNKVETILPFAKQIHKLVPEANIDVAHGQMAERDLTRIMHDFDQGKIKVLIATTIIENGIDQPNVNTLIVDNSSQFGLSQLYQIRGRIGRSSRQAFAYFLYHQEKLPPQAAKRLSALLSMQELGSGFNIAMRDLEIRGAGNILGHEQSGNANAIGLHLYSKLLHQSIKEIQTGKKQEPLLEVNLNLPLTAKLPSEYIQNEKKRLACYYQLSNLNNFTELNSLILKINKKFGPLPLEFKNLVEILKIRILCRRARIKVIDTTKTYNSGQPTEQKVILSFAEAMDWEKIGKLLKHNPAWLPGENKIKIDIKDLGQNWLQELKASLKILAK